MKLTKFLKEIFRDDAGVRHPKPKKVSLKWVLYWIIGLILSVLIPACLVYLESGIFNWNVFAIVWAENSKLYRGGYFISGFITILSFVTVGFLTPENMNGDLDLLGWKKIGRFFMFMSLILAITFFILAIILY